MLSCVVWDGNGHQVAEVFLVFNVDASSQAADQMLADGPPKIGTTYSGLGGGVKHAFKQILLSIPAVRQHQLNTFFAGFGLNGEKLTSSIK